MLKDGDDVRKGLGPGVNGAFGLGSEGLKVVVIETLPSEFVGKTASGGVKVFVIKTVLSVQFWMVVARVFIEVLVLDTFECLYPHIFQQRQL